MLNSILPSLVKVGSLGCIGSPLGRSDMRLGVISTSVRDAALDGATLLIDTVCVRAATALVSTFSLLG